MADHHFQLLPPYSDQLLNCHELVAFGLVGWAAWLVLPLSVHLPQLSSSSWWLDQSWRPCSFQLWWAGCLSLASHPRFQDELSCHSAPELVVGHEELPLAGGWLRDRSCRCASERGLGLLPVLWVFFLLRSSRFLSRKPGVSTFVAPSALIQDFGMSSSVESFMRARAWWCRAARTLAFWRSFASA